MWTPEPTHTSNHHAGVGDGQCLQTSQQPAFSVGLGFLEPEGKQVESDSRTSSWEGWEGRGVQPGIRQFPPAAGPGGRVGAAHLSGRIRKVAAGGRSREGPLVLVLPLGSKLRKQ